MSYLQAIVLGLVQGIAEFLPISSSGHLAILHNLFPGVGDAISDAAFDVLLHFGTLVAVCIVFRITIGRIIVEFFKMCRQIPYGTFRFRKANRYQIMALYSIVTTVLLVPFALMQGVFAGIGEKLWAVGVMLMLTAGLLFIADHSVVGNKQMKDMTFGQAIKLGLFQGLATIPGISRSGATISAGINMGFDREMMVEFSFIMSIPAVLGAVVMDLKEMIRGFTAANIGPYIVGTLVAAVAGVCSIKLLSLVAKRNKFGWFMWYCLAAGIFAVVLDIIR